MFSGINSKVILALFLTFVVGILFLVQPKSKNQLMSTLWESQIEQVGVGSPRLADVNNDQVLDIIIGSGFEWAEKGESAMNAIDGVSGEIIWRTTVPESPYGTPVLIDITGDGIVDTTASGRFTDFYMLDGKNGEIIWKLSEQNPTVTMLPCNFNSPTPVADIDGDGHRDIVVIQGGLANNTREITISDLETNEIIVDLYNKGNIQQILQELVNNSSNDVFKFKICQGNNCEPRTISRDTILYYSYDTLMTKIFLNQEGPGGMVYLISSLNGNILSSFPVPFDRESWSVPIYFVHNGSHRIIYGSGGERKDGFFFSQDIITGQLHWSVKIPNKGAISSPLLIRENNRSFVISNTMNGDIFKLDAISGDVVWQATVGKEYESYSSVAMIQLKGKPYRDVVSVFSRGIWPQYDSASLFIFDGVSGQRIFQKKTGFCNGASSPLIGDIDNDQLDDIILLTCTDRQPRLLVVSNDLKDIVSEPLSSGAYATPAIKDIDQDGFLDIIISRYHYINRLTLDSKYNVNYKNSWSEYRGSNWTGVSD